MRLPEEQQALELAQRITDFSDELVLLLSLKERWTDLKKEVDSIFDEEIEIIPPVEPDPSLLKNLTASLEPKEKEEAPEQKKRRGRPPKKDKDRAAFEQKMLNEAKGSEDI